MPRRNLLVAAGVGVAILIVGAVVVLGRGGESGSTKEFCSTLQAGEDPLVFFDRYDASDPTAAKATLTQGADRLRQLQRAAPGELKAPMTTLVRVADELVVLVARGPTAGAGGTANTATTHDFRDDFAAVEQASGVVVAFAQSSCGVSLGSSTVTGATVPPGTPAN
jgi:hypothetical protein